tara:strand:- start:13861 stop:16794 length:2934 start_codon:yes stop_codon:yes gene_type:complete
MNAWERLINLDQSKMQDPKNTYFGQKYPGTTNEKKKTIFNALQNAAGSLPQSLFPPITINKPVDSYQIPTVSNTQYAPAKKIAAIATSPGQMRPTAKVALPIGKIVVPEMQQVTQKNATNLKATGNLRLTTPAKGDSWDLSGFDTLNKQYGKRNYAVTPIGLVQQQQTTKWPASLSSRRTDKTVPGVNLAINKQKTLQNSEQKGNELGTTESRFGRKAVPQFANYEYKGAVTDLRKNPQNKKSQSSWFKRTQDVATPGRWDGNQYIKAVEDTVERKVLTSPAGSISSQRSRSGIPAQRPTSLNPEAKKILEEYRTGMQYETDVRPETKEQLRGGVKAINPATGGDWTQNPVKGKRIPYLFENSPNYGKEVGGTNYEVGVDMLYKTGDQTYDVRRVYGTDAAGVKTKNLDARFFSEQQEDKRLGTAATEAMDATKTPLISGKTLNSMVEQKLARKATPADMTATGPSGKLKYENNRGQLNIGGVRTDLQGFIRGTKDPDTGDYSKIPVYIYRNDKDPAKRLYRQGVPTNRDLDEMRRILADPRRETSVNQLITNASRERGKPVERGFTPFLNREDVYGKVGGIRKGYENPTKFALPPKGPQNPYGVTEAQLTRDYSEAIGILQTQHRADNRFPMTSQHSLAESYRRVLASAAASGAMVGAPSQAVSDYMRSSNVQRVVEAGGRQLRHAMIQAKAQGQVFNTDQLIAASNAIGSKIGVSGNAIINAATANVAMGPNREVNMFQEPYGYDPLLPKNQQGSTPFTNKKQLRDREALAALLSRDQNLLDDEEIAVRDSIVNKVRNKPLDESEIYALSYEDRGTSEDGVKGYRVIDDDEYRKAIAASPDIYLDVDNIARRSPQAPVTQDNFLRTSVGGPTILTTGDIPAQAAALRARYNADPRITLGQEAHNDPRVLQAGVDGASLNAPAKQTAPVPYMDYRNVAAALGAGNEGNISDEAFLRQRRAEAIIAQRIAARNRMRV